MKIYDRKGHRVLKTRSVKAAKEDLKIGEVLLDRKVAHVRTHEGRVIMTHHEAADWLAAY